MRQQQGASTIAGAITAAVVCVLASVVLTSAAPADVIREGTIENIAAGAIAVASTGTASTGASVTSIKISPTTPVRGRQKTTLDAIKAGDFVGVTAKRGSDGTLVAVAINIFPAELKGRIPEGQSPMASGDTMTNPTVMENVVKVENRTLFLKYKDGAAAIAVPPTTDVNRLTVIRLSDLHPGMHVVIRGQANPDGSITASSITADRP